MKDSVTPAKTNTTASTMEVSSECQPEVQPEVKAEVAKKSDVNNRKTSSMRAQMAAAAAAKAKDSNPAKDPFSVEFTFDVNEDPFKPRKTLGASPTRISPTSPVDVNIFFY